MSQKYSRVKMHETLTPAQREANRVARKADTLARKIAQVREWANDASLSESAQALHRARLAKLEAEYAAL